MIMRSAILSGCLFLLFAGSVRGQSSYDAIRAQIAERQQNTRSQIATLDRQIENYTRRLTETSQEYDQLYRQYEEINRLVSLRRERIRQMNREQRDLQQEIGLIEQNLSELQERLDQLIHEYQETLTYLYKHGRTTELALILTSDSLNQLLIRSYYLSRFNTHVQAQVDQIEETQAQLAFSRADLEQTVERNIRVLAEIREETRNLEQQERQQRQLVDALQSDINSLEQQRAVRQQQRENLETTMENLIREEERLRRAAATGSPVATREVMLSDAEIEAFSADFRSQRGQLLWPVENGTITERFGERVHPVHGTRTRNLGVDISALPRSGVRVVSDGLVYGVQPLQGYGEVIFVNHGTYNTAYGNLSDIFVRRNQVVRKGDIIGLSGDGNSVRGSTLFFLIREGSQMADPERWLQNPRP
ncbi:MAG: hypothetical protein EA360_02760 [Balneolaceae bacterium]|nr:MAG: hypothetical protein EA360_02760 [Balneolaceae bacterium]